MNKTNLGLGLVYVLAVVSLLVLFSAGIVEAHSPSDVSIDYDLENEELTVEITHSVTDTKSHYIENIVVQVDGETVIDENYTEQPDSTSFEYTYDLQAEKNSTIEATAYCSISGSASDTLTLGEDEDSPGFTSTLLLLSVVTAVAIYHKKSSG